MAGWRSISSISLAALLAAATPPALAAPAAEVSATRESPCPEGTERVGAKPPEGDRTGCVLRVDGAAVLHGPQTTWYPNGNKRQETHFREGRPHGPKLDWGIRGNLMQKWEYRDGRLHGEHVIYSPAGSVLRRAIYVDGNRVESAPSETPPRKAGRPAPRPRPSQPPKPKPPPQPAAAPAAPAKPARAAFRCELSSDALEQRLAADRKYFEELTRGQLRMIHSPERLTVRLSAGGDAPAESRLEDGYKYRLESTNELGFAQNDPVVENVKEREAGMRAVAGVLEKRLALLLDQWRELMKDVPAEPADPAEPAGPMADEIAPVPGTSGEVTLHEADLQTISGAALPSRLLYSLREDGSRNEIRLSNCRILR